MQSIFRRSRHICWGTYHSGRSNSQTLGGKMMRPADIAIAWSPLGPLHQFGSADLNVLLHFGENVEVRWCQIRTAGRMGKNLPVPSVQEVHCGAGNVWPGIIVHLRGLRFQTDEDVQEEVKRWLSLQDDSFYRRGVDSFICLYGNCLNIYVDYVEK
jgi:hypothetical protein